MGEHLLNQQDSGEDPQDHRETGQDWSGAGNSADGADAHLEADDVVGGSTTSGEEEDGGQDFEDERGDRMGGTGSDARDNLQVEQGDEGDKRNRNEDVEGSR